MASPDEPAPARWTAGPRPQPHAEGSYLFVNKTLIEGVAVLVLLSFDTGRIAGLDRLWRDRRSGHLAAVPSDRMSERTVGQGS